MLKHEYKAYLRSFKDNGVAHTIRHAQAGHRMLLTFIDMDRTDYEYDDLLAWRVRWLANPDTTASNIIKLTSPILNASKGK
jgi:uncharacterized protein YbjT (DUF2867 family)